jgi:hypothetical protein
LLQEHSLVLVEARACRSCPVEERSFQEPVHHRVYNLLRRKLLLHLDQYTIDLMFVSFAKSCHTHNIPAHHSWVNHVISCASALAKSGPGRSLGSELTDEPTTNTPEDQSNSNQRTIHRRVEGCAKSESSYGATTTTPL